MIEFIAIDFETAMPSRASACAVGLVKVVDNVIVKKYFSLIQPPDNQYFKGNIAIHGIKPEHTVNAPTFPEVLSEIADIIGDSAVFSWSKFDETVLNGSILLYGLESEYNMFELTDACAINGNVSLDVVCKNIGYELDHHNALADAEGCARVVMHNLGLKTLEIVPIKLHYMEPEGHTKIGGNAVVKDLSCVAHQNNPFYDKKVVISGVFANWIDRNDLAQILKCLGADVDTTVGKRTHYLIAGDDVGPSKLIKMQANAQLRDDAFIISESELLRMIDNCVVNIEVSGNVKQMLITCSDGSFRLVDSF